MKYQISCQSPAFPRCYNWFPARSMVPHDRNRAWNRRFASAFPISKTAQ
jgi:hypothetical protein